MKIEDIATNSNPKLNNGIGSHEWLHGYYRSEWKKKSIVYDGIDLNRYLGQLKRLRSDADYGHDSLTDEEVKGAKDLCDKVIVLLKKHHKI